MVTPRTLLATLLIVVLSAAAVQAEEHYFEFQIQNKKQLDEITRVISIVRVDGFTVHAYANDTQLAQFARMGIEYQILPRPSTLATPDMAESLRALEDWDTYPTYSQYDSMMYKFAEDYPSLCRIEVIGTTNDGHELLCAVISDNVSVEETEPEVLYASTMHGNETTGYVLMLRLIDSLLVSYGTDPRITGMVDNLEIWINPNHNPDGTYAGGDNSVYGATRGNDNGIDLNRNFPDPSAGDHPDGNSWQIETIAMMDFAEAHNFVISGNFHGGTEVVNYPWDTWSRRHADDGWFQDISHAYADSCQKYSPSGYMSGYDDGITNGYDWYHVDGGRQDYMNWWHGCREVTLEISDAYILSAGLLPAHWVYNRISLLDWLDNARFGIRGIVTDNTTGLPLGATVEVLGHDLDNSYVYSDPDLGDYYRMIASGTYDLRFTSPGYLPLTVYGVSVSDGSSVVVDAALDPLPYEPVLQFVSQNAGVVDPGDANVNMHITLENIGGGNSNNTTGTLTTSDPYVTITQDYSTYPMLVAEGGQGLSNSAYVFSVSSSCPQEYPASFELAVTADGGYSETLNFQIFIGPTQEGFESGDFTVYDWQMSGSLPWQITTTSPYEGTYCAQSGSIGHSQVTTMSVTLSDLAAGDISFYYYVSSESGYDFLRFSIDGLEKNSWSGSVGWTEATYAVSAGVHTFTWTYDKDVNTVGGSDLARVDYITFPPSDDDPDGDGYANDVDNCPSVYNPDQADSDVDDVGNLCDNCPDDANTDQADSDGDLHGNVCDNCPTESNADQADGDTDEVGDVCDNCEFEANTDQADADSDDIGNVCDNCPDDSNADQKDTDSDTIGDICDNCHKAVNPSQDDEDSDDVGDLCDNCPGVHNPGQEDADEDGIGDACEFVCGDIDGNQTSADIADLVFLIDYMFNFGAAPPVVEAADVDGQPPLDISDLVWIVDYMFESGPALQCP